MTHEQVVLQQLAFLWANIGNITGADIYLNP